MMLIEYRDFLLFWLRVIPVVLAFATAVTCAHAGGWWRYWTIVFLLEGIGILFAIRVNDWQAFQVVIFRNTASILCSTRIYWLASRKRAENMRDMFANVGSNEYPQVVVESKDTLTALKVLHEMGHNPLVKK